ncbi:uncharacterized protein N7500_002384 [Penicillium coprophilum]|uniref:uncharacterized protein n=1 Tax=Penicillium coprophilum TaxID=36646 RepID=UPI00239848F5|nr:uncharacterized protein N7500_002384 [Penicillium coprophilum]KAJ5169601.1 hypothetical protein N7500_002384 [Penicillium coprophilum]
MSTSQSPSAGDMPGTITYMSTDPTPQGSYWRANNIYQPQIWAEPRKRLCDCSNHNEQQWPIQFAELIIAPCAFRCPFCNEFNKAGKTRLMASNLRRHINKTHIEGNPARFGTLVVAAGVIGSRGMIPRSAQVDTRARDSSHSM